MFGEGGGQVLFLFVDEDLFHESKEDRYGKEGGQTTKQEGDAQECQHEAQIHGMPTETVGTRGDKFCWHLVGLHGCMRSVEGCIRLKG
jgi:hypothetical protein